MTRSTRATAVAAALLYPISWLALAGPPWLAPSPLLLTIPAFLWHDTLRAATVPVVSLLTPIAFCLWNPQLFRDEARIPRRSFGLLGFLAAIDIAYFLQSWTFGLQYQGRPYVITMAAINIVLLATLIYLGAKAVLDRSFRRSLLFHWAVFAWLSFYALPFLGDAP